MIVASGLLSRWFTTRIGAIMSLPYAAIGAGMLILPPLTQVLLTTYDWRVDASPARRRRAAGAAAGDAAAARPHDGRLGRMARACACAAATGTARPWTRLDGASRTSAFWGLFAAYLFTSVAAYSVLPHSVAYLVEQRLRSADRRQRLRHGRHAVGRRHPRRRLAVGPLRPPADRRPSPTSPPCSASSSSSSSRSGLRCCWSTPSCSSSA